MTSGYYLSKSKILSGWQCHKRLWLEVHDRDKARVSAATEHAFQVGHEVGEIARRVFPDGVLIGHDHSLHLALDETARRLAEPGPLTLFEATLSYEGVLVRTDVLIRDDVDNIRLIEVKASTRVKPVNYIDCAVQAWVLAGVGWHPARVELAHINNQFIYPGDGQYGGLFSFVDVTDRVSPMLEHVPRWLIEYRETLAGEMPSIRIGPHCRNPYECAFLEYCTPPQPDYPVRSLPGGGKIVWQLLEEGIEDIRDIPPDRLTSESQRRVRQVTARGRPELDPAAAKTLLVLPWPRYYFDFETVGFAVPVWEGTRPYQALPFQWSCHVQTENGELEHREWLAQGDGPPMRDCAITLIAALGESGPVFTYTSYEEIVLKRLAHMFPDLAPALESIIARLFDLYPVTRKHYYHPDMLGSWSIKAVLPTIAADMDYDSLGEIREGAAASDAFLEIMDPATDMTRRARLRKELIEYCAYDTLALVRLAAFLQGADTATD
jgi:predicted RecB family nuclease